MFMFVGAVKQAGQGVQERRDPSIFHCIFIFSLWSSSILSIFVKCLTLSIKQAYLTMGRYTAHASLRFSLMVWHKNIL